MGAFAWDKGEKEVNLQTNMLKYARSILLAACLFVAAVAVAQGKVRPYTVQRSCLDFEI